jgi:hypothetical protein
VRWFRTLLAALAALVPAEVKIAYIRAWAIDADGAGVYPLASACRVKR